MALRFLGKDPNSDQGQSPTVWDDGECYVIQGWRITDAAELTELVEIPAHETVVRIQESYLPLYERTRQFRIYEAGVIPGLFQTEAYATARLARIIDVGESRVLDLR